MVDLSNAVSAFATILSGVTALLLSALVGRQPRRWLAAYWGIVLTGATTVWYHGFGEGFQAGTADIGTNLLLAWLLLLAVLGDYYSPQASLWIGGLAGLVDLAYVVWRTTFGAAMARNYALGFGEFGGFSVGELLLILNSLLVFSLLYGRLARIPANARPLLYALTAYFLVGMLLATASNGRLDLGVLAYHALWHLVGAFGFIVLWAFNHVRFSLGAAQASWPGMDGRPG